MEDLVDRLLGLLGRSQEDSQFLELTTDLGEAPQCSAPEFRFPKSGFTITANKGLLKAVMLHLQTAAVQSDWFKPFSGKLPAGLAIEDDPRTASFKLGLSPFRTVAYPTAEEHGEQDIWNYYDWRSMTLTLVHQQSSGSLKAIIVRLVEKDLNSFEIEEGGESSRQPKHSPHRPRRKR